MEFTEDTFIYKKRYKTAYKISSEHALSAGPSFAEADGCLEG